MDEPRKYVTITRAEEAELVRRAREGDEAAWMLLHQRHAGFLVARIRRYAGRFSVLNFAEDIESEGIRAFAMAIQQFDPARKTRLVTLLTLLVRRLVLDYLARETRLHVDGVPPKSFDDHDPGDDRETDMPHPVAPVPSSVPPELKKQLDIGMARLSPQSRYLLQLRYIEEWRIEDIQERAYPKPVSRIRVHRDLDRALKKLRRLM